jgi:hypothetical protein
MNIKEFEGPNEWNKFCSFIVHKNRYVLNKHWTNFLDIILFTAQKRETILEKGIKLVRARIGSYYEELEEQNGEIKVMYGPLRPKEIKAPPPKKTKDGRINPRGISCLYLSDNVETAILEVRPWLGQEVSVGYFIIKNTLKCIDTSRDKKGAYFPFGKGQPKLTPDEKEEFVWSGINDSFSRPVRSEDESINYIPTQFLSEFFKTNGYDGIIYKSALTEKGFNIVLFNPKNAHLKGARLFQIKSIKQIFEECGNLYTL